MLAREPVLEWLHRLCGGKIVGHDWADPTIEDHPAFRVLADDSFQHVAYARVLPPALVRASRLAQRSGQATLLEALTLLFAPSEWRVVARGYAYTPLGAEVAPLAMWLEASGIGPEIHAYDRDRLATLLAQLPTWFPTRGTLPSAARIEALSGAEGWLPDAGPQALTDEVFVAWPRHEWQQRASGALPEFRIEGGFLKFQGAEPAIEAPGGDVVIAWHPGWSPGSSFRLLAPWLVPRLCLQRESV